MTLALVARFEFAFALAFAAASALMTPAASAQAGYQKPPPQVQQVLDAVAAPVPYFSPDMRQVLFAQVVRHPPIKDLAEPVLRLAGVRMNPRSNGLSGYRIHFTGFSLKQLPDGSEVVIALPQGARLGAPVWNADATMFAFSNETSDSVELWVWEAANGRARRLDGISVNPVLGWSVQWMTDQRTLIVKTVPPGRPAPPTAPETPGPKIQESAGIASASSSYETRDVLSGPHDADLFDHYASSQLVKVHAGTGKVSPLGKPALHGRVLVAPGGNRMLVERIHRPYSFIRPYWRFPKAIEIWSADGALIETVAEQPLAESVPIRGVPVGPREHLWRPTEAATLVWTEALDGGDNNSKVPYRERLMMRREGESARELARLEHRFSGIRWLERGGLALVSEDDWSRRWTRTFILDTDDPSVARRPLWEMSFDERYQDPGVPVTRLLANGMRVIRQHGDSMYLSGTGSSAQGDRPFLDRLDLRTLKTERLFRSDPRSLESFRGWLDLSAGTFITRRETATEPPNLNLRTLAMDVQRDAAAGEAVRESSAKPITHLSDPTPQIRGISKRLVTYTRADGVPLSFTLYLPPGYREGTRLPTVLWAYPLDFADRGVAGQIEGSPNRFTTIEGPSELFFLLQGYAVLSDASMPVIGPPDAAYDRFNEQIVMNAKAAIDKAVDLGVTDRDRVGVGGHSHGALMAAALLAHSDLFRAGIARSGAYNKSLVPFGFQNELRTLYQAREVYLKASPLFDADRIRYPLLLIHGELDQNPGTTPLQSEKMYEALRGIGKKVRLVMLPHENHAYIARESTEHVLFEMLSWFDRFVKDAQPRP